MNRDILEAPFAPEQIKQREGNFGKMLDYIEGHAVIQRLNDALDSAWSFEILEHHIHIDINEVLVLGRLTAGGISKCQFGSSTITRAKQSGEVVSLADDLKAAATDSLKKCATMLGVGLSLYGAKPRNEKRHTDDKHPNVTPFRREQDRRENNNGNGNSNGRLSAKQHQYAISLAQNRGMTRQELDAHCVHTYGAGIDYLNKKDASGLIEALRGADKAVRGRNDAQNCARP